MEHNDMLEHYDMLEQVYTSVLEQFLSKPELGLCGRFYFQGGFTEEISLHQSENIYFCTVQGLKTCTSKTLDWSEI